MILSHRDDSIAKQITPLLSQALYLLSLISNLNISSLKIGIHQSLLFPCKRLIQQVQIQNNDDD